MLCGSDSWAMRRRRVVPRVFVCVALVALVALPVRGEVDFAAVRDQVSEERLGETLARFAAHESRVVGYPGADEAARYIQETFREIGLVGITVHEYDVTVPVESAPRQHPGHRDGGDGATSRPVAQLGQDLHLARGREERTPDRRR